MAKKSSKTNGEPPRLKVPQQGAKPLLVVTDDDDQPVLDLPHYLAWHKATGTAAASSGVHSASVFPTHVGVNR